MNIIKKIILTRLGYICPKCGSKLVRQYATCHTNTYGYVICKNHKFFSPYNKCDYQQGYKLL